MEPSSAGFSGFAALKIAMAFGMPAAMAALIGMLLMPPRSPREFVARTACTVVSSFLFGPLLAIGMIAWMPDIMSSAYLRWITTMRQKGLLEWIAEMRGKLCGTQREAEKLSVILTKRKIHYCRIPLLLVATWDRSGDL